MPEGFGNAQDVPPLGFRQEGSLPWGPPVTPHPTEQNPWDMPTQNLHGPLE